MQGESEAILHQRAVDWFQESTPPPDAPVEAWRTGFEQLCGRFAPPDDVRIEPIDAGGVPALLVTAPGAAADRLVVHYHAGGYVMGSARGYREFASRLSRVSGASVLVPDYRLAPEHPYPAAIDDAIAAYRWATSRWTPARIVLSGDSAGGGLCLGTLLAIRDAGEPLPAGGVGISPFLDLAGEGESVTTNHGIDPLVSRDLILGLAQIYIGDRDPHATPLASPLWGDHGGLPPLFLTVSASEVIRDDVVRLAASVRAAGGQVETDMPDGLVHIWTLFPFLAASQRSMDAIGAFIRARMGG